MRLSGKRGRTAAGVSDAGAYLTVFLSLSLTIMLSLIFTLFYGIRVNMVRMQTQILMDTAANSVLAEYSRALLDQYDLFFIDTSYGTGSGSVENTRRHFQEYLEKNTQNTEGDWFGQQVDLCPVSISVAELVDTRFACDDSYAALEEQINAYMSALPAGEAAAQFLSMVDVFEGVGLDTGEWDRQHAEVSSGLESARRQAQEALEAAADDGTSGSGGASAEGKIRPEDITDPGETVNSFRASPMIGQVFGSSDNISSCQVSDNLLTERSVHTGGALAAENSHHYERVSKAMCIAYVFEKCGTFLHPDEDGQIRYEAEYILAGKDSDRANLEAMLTRIAAVRTAANCVYLFSSSSRRKEAEAFAGTIASVTLTPQLTALYTLAIMLAWGYIESVQDLQVLTGGGKVPLLKDDESWQTSVENIFSPGSGAGSSAGDGSGEGLGYEDYLKIFLFLENTDTRDGRLCDVIEMNIRRTPGNEQFCFDWCMDTFTSSITVNSTIGYSCSMTRTLTYN